MRLVWLALLLSGCCLFCDGPVQTKSAHQVKCSAVDGGAK